jgi:hypothetical protein
MDMNDVAFAGLLANDSGKRWTPCAHAERHAAGWNEMGSRACGCDVFAQFTVVIRDDGDGMSGGGLLVGEAGDAPGRASGYRMEGINDVEDSHSWKKCG